MSASSSQVPVAQCVLQSVFMSVTLHLLEDLEIHQFDCGYLGNETSLSRVLLSVR